MNPRPPSTNILSRPFKIGKTRIRNRVLLAPMSGVSDLPFRNLAWDHGAGLVVSEMVASEALVAGDADMLRKARSADLCTNMVQLAGRDECWMSLAANMAEDSGASIIDINMGCPARRVTTGQCGSALMREPEQAIRLVKAVISSVNIPVTLKMRLGWDDDTINAPEIAARAEDCGIAMITVHARTRCQFYKGKADWNAVRAVRERVTVPLAINGDIFDTSSASAAMAASGADAVMIGRAAYGAPWLPGMVAGAPPQDEDSLIAKTASDHLIAMLDFYGQRGLRQARKHIAWYFDRYSGQIDPQLRRYALTSDSPEAVLGFVQNAFCASQELKAA